MKLQPEQTQRRLTMYRSCKPDRWQWQWLTRLRLGGGLQGGQCIIQYPYATSCHLQTTCSQTQRGGTITGFKVCIWEFD